MSRTVTCERVKHDMASVLAGGAPSALHEHIADCDECRDARHAAERARALVIEAGRDFELPPDLLARLGEPARPLARSVDAEPSRELTPGPHPARPPWRARVAALAKRWTVPVLAAAAAAALLTGRGKPPGTSADDFEVSGPPWRGQVLKVLSHGGQLVVCEPAGNTCQAARQGDEIPAGSVIRTDRGTLAELSFTDGSLVSLDRETSLRLNTRGRGGELLRGAIVADIEHQPSRSVRFELTSGHVDVLGTKLALRSDDDSVVVHVARGQVRLADHEGRSTLVLAGEEGRLLPGSPPTASPAASLGEALGFSESIHDEGREESETRPRALGELKARKPGETSERAGAVRLDSHAVRVKIAGAVARTEVEEVFTNQTDDVLEGIFRFPLPPDAKIERLALDSDGKLEEGAFVERDRAAAIWRGAIVNAAPQLRQTIKDEIVWVPGPWRDPALLEWQRGGRFELRVFPIPKRGSRRVVLAYSQLVKQSAGVSHYSYPLSFDPSGNAGALQFSLDLQVRGHDPAFRVRAPGWAVASSQSGGVAQLSFDSRSFVPSGDFNVDYVRKDRASEVAAWAYQPPKADEGSAPYVAISLRPELPRSKRRDRGRPVALVVDASRSVFGENYRRATSLAARLAKDLDRSGRVTVLACDSTCRGLNGELWAPGPEASRAVRRFLEQETPAGPSDVARAVEQAFVRLRHEPGEPMVVYIGDGLATTGPTRAATIESAVRAATPRGGRVTALGIGPESDTESLLALARGGGGVALPYVPGQPLSDAAATAFSALYGAAVRDVRVELPIGISQVAPARVDPFVSGSELLVTGRLISGAVKGDVILRGSLDGIPFEQSYPLDVSASSSGGNAFVPRLFAAARIADLERDGSASAREEATKMSIAHGVASRYTSLLVLESEAMYRAFGLQRSRQMPEYAADIEAEGTSDGELALSESEAKPASAPEPSRGPRLSAIRRPVSSEGRLGAAPSADASPRAKARAFSPAPEPPVTLRLEEARPSFSDREVARPSDDRDGVRVTRQRPPSLRPLVPMRRIWERKGEIMSDRLVPKAASRSALAEAERALSRDESRRTLLQRAFALSSAAGDLSQAIRLAERWVEKEPLDPEALTALADVEARSGRRDSAIRLLGSVLDVRPGDTAAHKRLARLERWAGRSELACRHSIAIADNQPSDVTAVTEAVRCARSSGATALADALLASSPSRTAVEQLVSANPADDTQLRGDVSVEATWSGGADVDVTLLDTEGHRISWLGAATRPVISARYATSTARESLALRGAAPGEYVVEVARGAGEAAAQGELVITVAGSTRRLPFHLDGERKAVALLRISMQPRLVPL